MIGEHTTVVVPWRALRREHGGPHEDVMSVLISLVGDYRTLVVCEFTDRRFVEDWLHRAGTNMRTLTLDERSARTVSLAWLASGRGSVLYFDTDPDDCASLAKYGAGTLCCTFGAWEPDDIPSPTPWSAIESGTGHEDHLRRGRASVES